MIFVSWILVVLAIILLIIGLGFALRFLSYMMRGVDMRWGSFFGMVILAALCIVVGLVLLFMTLPVTIFA
jgi:hypothetical protein